MRAFNRRNMLGAAAIGATAIVVSLDKGKVLLAANQFISISPPAPTPTPGGNGEPVTPPGQSRAPYAVSIPIFSGKVLHWTQASYSYIHVVESDGSESAPTDPANGRVINSDVWLQLDQDGTSTRFHAVNTYSDGSLHQETLEDRGQNTSIVILGRDYPASPLGCALRRQPLPKPGYQPPPFVNEAMLPSYGYHAVGGLTGQPPGTPPLAGASPVAAFGPDNTAQGWETTEARDGGLSNAVRIEVGAQGRVIRSQTRLTNTSGTYINETWFAYGPIEVYAPSSIPNSVFTLSQKAREACHV